MKKTTVLLILGTMALVSACKDQATTNAISTDEAAQMVSMSLASNSMGATAIIQSSVATGNSSRTNAPQKVKSLNSDYTISVDTTFSITSKAGAIISYSFTADYGYEFTFNTLLQLTQASEKYTYTGTYDAPLISSTHTGSGAFTFANMITTIWTVNGTFKRTSDDTFKGVQAKLTHSETNLNLTNILVNRSTSTIQSGTATLTIAGTLPNKGDFSFTGNLTFNGANSATLVIKDKTYTVNLITGDYQAK